MEPQGRILDGNLETLGLQSTLKMLALGGKSGVLSVTSGQERLTIFLDTGQIVDLDEPGIPAPDIIDMFRLLKRMERVPRAESAELRRLANGNLAIAMSLLVRRGIISPQEYQQRVEFRIIQAISRAVRWERGRFEFHREISRASTLKPFDMDHVLLESIRLADEWSHVSTASLSRNTVARWMPEPQFKGNIAGMNLTPQEIDVLCLSNGQFPLYAISCGLLLPEPQVATMMRHLIDLNLIEVVDSHLEVELEYSLTNLLTQSQHMLTQDSRPTPERRLLTLIRAMGACVNGLITHHATYARSLRGRGELPRAEVNKYLTTTFEPMLLTLQREYPRMEGIIRFEDGRLNFRDLETLDRVVRGQELSECYWDASQVLSHLMRSVFDRVIADEVGKSRAGRQYEDLWSAFLREIDEEIARHSHRRAALRVQAERAAPSRSIQQSAQEMIPAYQFAPETQRRFR